MPAENERRITIRIPAQLADKIERLSQTQYRSLHGQILYLLAKGIEYEEKLGQQEAPKDR
jgi:hypothetical protein